ncbi:MAG: peptidylprolyl isomerase [Akkermansiaceae bacterium]|nr:peptidylprolyl isomerase [Akkermansiaceae bacterium]
MNGEPVDPSLIDDAFARLKSEAEVRSSLSCCEHDALFREQATQEVIDGILLAQEAEKRVPIPAADEVRQALEDELRRWRSHGASWDVLEQQRDAIRDELIARLRMERFTAGLWENLHVPDDEALRLWLEENPDGFRLPPRIRVTHLLKHPGTDPWEIHRVLCEVREMALAGADFSALAAQHTERKDGVTDIGWITRELAPDPIEILLFSLRAGEISPVVFHDQAFHLFRIDEAEPARFPPFEEIAADARQAAMDQARRKILKSLAQDLRQQADIRGLENPA